MRWKGRVCFPFENRMVNRQAEWVRIGGESLGEGSGFLGLSQGGWGQGGHV